MKLDVHSRCRLLKECHGCLSRLLDVWGVVWVLVFTSLFSAPMFAQVQSRFDEANQHVTRGEFKAAVEQYHAMIRDHGASPALYFNLGNAYLAQELRGKAIHAYLQAQALAPRDPDIDHNLRKVRVQAGLSEQGAGSLWDRLRRRVPPFLWVGLCLSPIWGLGILQLVRALRPTPDTTWYRWGGAWSQGIAILGLLLFAALVFSARHASHAVILSPETDLFTSPFEDAKVLVQLPEGLEVRVTGQKDTWRQVRSPRGEVGWLPERSLGLLVPY